MPFNFEFPGHAEPGRAEGEACSDGGLPKKKVKSVQLTAAELGNGVEEDLEVRVTREGDTVRVALGMRPDGRPRQIEDSTKAAIVKALNPMIYTLLPEPEDVISRDPDGKIDQIDL